MSLSSAIVWEVNPLASDTQCGGGFHQGASGTDYSQQTTAQATGTVTSAGTTITATSAIFTNLMVGNIITDGTTYKEITAFTSSTIVTVDSDPSWVAATVFIGGSLATPGKAAGLKVAGNIVWLKATATSVLTTGTANVSGGVVLDSTGGTSQSAPSKWEGYTTTRGDKGQFSIQVPNAGVSSVTVVKNTGQYVVFASLAVDGQSKTSIRGIDAEQTETRVLRCKASNCTNSGIFIGGTTRITVFQCQATGCSGSGAGINDQAGIRICECESYGNSVPGFIGGTTTFVRCIASANSGGTTDGFSQNSIGATYISCIAYNNGRSGFDLTGIAGLDSHLENCIAESNGGEGFATDGVKALVYMINCGGYLNTSGNYNSGNLPHAENFIAGTNSFFTAPGSGDFSLNKTLGGGLGARAGGYPGLMPRGTSTGYLDAGAIQHQDPAGGGIKIPVPLTGGMA